MNDIVKARIKSKRKESGLTQELMAEKMGVASSTYWEIESGDSIIINPHIEKIASILNCTWEELLVDRDANTDNILLDIQGKYGDMEKKYDTMEERYSYTIQSLQQDNKRLEEQLSLCKDSLKDKELIMRMRAADIEKLTKEIQILNNKIDSLRNNPEE